MRTARPALAALLLSASSAKTLPPASQNGTATVLVLVGHQDATYDQLAVATAEAAAVSGLSLWTVTGNDTFSALASEVKAVVQKTSAASVFYAGHGTDGDSAQDYASSAVPCSGVVLLSSFLTRSKRPALAACAAKWAAAQPVHTPCPGFNCTLGYCVGGCLKDGVHKCDASGASEAPAYPLPTLTVGGSMDGVVRVSRIAEAWHSQKTTPVHQVVLVEGMNHGDLMDKPSPDVAKLDLPSQLGPVAARERTASAVASFLVGAGKAQATAAAEGVDEGGTLKDPSAFFAPFESMFRVQEGSWWWGGANEESGASAWAAAAQELMAAPLPCSDCAFGRLSNEFHMLSDDAKIPPYYRAKHRAAVELAPGGTGGNRTLASTNVAQLRYVELSKGGFAKPLEISEDGWLVTKEEKAAVLATIPDDGRDFTSAIEIATKLASRQFVHNLLGAPAPDSLDDGSRCMAINRAALALALASSSADARARYLAKGTPLAMAPDKTPTPNGGPWFIWSYLQYAPGANSVKTTEVQSWASFTALDGIAYGAGTHYCKLLSPARALEWIYTDGLR